MPLSLAPLALPPNLAAVYAANVDDDPADELILESREAAGDQPDRVRLTILHFSTTGTITSKTEISLGNKAQIWDAQGALYVEDRDGIVRYTGSTPTRIVSMTTPLSAVAATTPVHAEFLHDLNSDGKPEITLYGGGKISVFSADGAPMGSVSATAEGSLESSWRTGAQAVTIGLHAPPMAVGDVDGDGWLDLMLPSHSKLSVWFGAATYGARSVTMNLPLDLEPREEPPRPGQTRRTITGVWLQDVDHDKKVDLAVQRLVTDGSFFGATSEMVYARGRGDGFGTLSTLATSSAAFGVELVDFDGDGDLDWVVPEVDVGMTNLARAMVSKAVRVDLRMYSFANGAFSTTPVALRGVSFPLTPSGRFQVSYKGDIDGDGRLDLVTNDGEDRVRVYRGTAGGLEQEPLGDVAVRVPLGDDTLFVHDLTGDKKAEIVVWGAGESSGALIRQ